MWINKSDTNELIYKTKTRLTDLETKLTVTKGKTWGGDDKLGGWD